MSAKNNYVSEQMFNSRITCHGQVTDLSNGFKLKDEQPFSLYIRPKAATAGAQDVLVSVKLYKEDECSPIPVTLHGWQEFMAVELDASNAELLARYDIYWGAGDIGTPVVTE